MLRKFDTLPLVKPRTLAALALTLVAIGLSSAAVFSTFLEVSRRGEDSAAVARFFMLRHGLGMLGLVAGGAVALARGPRVTAVLGALVAAAGYLATAAGAPLLAGVGAAAFGVGMLRPCPYVIGAEELGWDDPSPAAPAPHRFAAVAAFAAAVGVAMNVGSELGSRLAVSIVNHGGGFALVYRSAGALLALSTALLAAVAVLGRAARGATAGAPAAGPYREAAQAPAAGAPSSGRALRGLAVLFALHVAYSIGSAFGLPLPPPSLLVDVPDLGMGDVETLMTLGEVAVVGGSVVVFVILLVAALKRSTQPPLRLAGAGLVLFAAGAGLLAAGSSWAVLFAVGSVVAAAGGAAVSSVPIAYAAVGVRGRAATLVVAAWSCAGYLVSTLSSALGAVVGVRPLLIVTAVLGLGAGGGLLRYAKALHRQFDPALGP